AENHDQSQVPRIFSVGTLGRVDGFDQDEAARKGDEGRVVFAGLLAAERDALEALQLADGLLDPSAAAVERSGEEARPACGAGAVWDDGADASVTRRLPVGVRVAALVGHHRP